MTGLLIYPTHSNCVEAEAAFTAHRVSAASYPARTTVDDHTVRPNCWNAEADAAEQLGFSVMQTVCPACSHRVTCEQSGYLQQIKSVRQASVVLSTHQRAAHTGLRELSAGRKYVSIHENPIDLLRPGVAVTFADLLQVQMVLNRMLKDPTFLDWFGDHGKVDDDGHRYPDQELAVRKERQLEFVRSLANMVDRLVLELQSAQCTTEWHHDQPCRRPEGIEQTLFFATRVAGMTTKGQPWRFILAAATGELHTAAIIASKQFHKGGGQNRPFMDKVVVGFRNNTPHPDAVTWFNDATITPARLQSILGIPVNDRTPPGQLRLQRKAVQVPRDITRRTSAGIVQNTLRGVLCDRHAFERVGIICHRSHVADVNSLEPEYRRRIVRVSYFGSGDERSSNDWYRQCDLIIVAGTPRVSPKAIATYLVQVGEIQAACNEPTWGPIQWSGLTESAEPVSVKSRGYYDERWRLAHRDLVRAAIVQAVGRGRGILETGCEVLVLSTEECGLRISDTGTTSVNRSAVRILEALNHLTLQNPNRASIGKWSVSTADIASATSLSKGEVRKQLVRLEQLGQVTKVGERGGWRPVVYQDSVLPASSCPSNMTLLPSLQRRC